VPVESLTSDCLATIFGPSPPQPRGAARRAPRAARAKSKFLDKFPAWAVAARIVFSFTPNSAACERVFSLLKFMFGDQQWAALGDYIQAALMLKYNERAVG
jgi:hypothetical protein